MITISLCMIVKNEEKVLRRCLDSVADLVDEMIIVDTGSDDDTMKIASSYSNAKVYEFAWIDDFATARNFAFSKATMEYIYSADADEVLDEENRERFKRLKQCLLPEIEIVQMKYGNQLEYGSVYNYDEEYRPKLFRRLREFVWMDAIHETVKTTPVIYDSDIVIIHKPHERHADRDFRAFRKMIARGEGISERLHNMYARELFIAGCDADFICAGPFFEESTQDPKRSEKEIKEACSVVAAAALKSNDEYKFFKYSMKVMALGGNAEVCCLLGDYYVAKKDYDEAVTWYYNACYEIEADLALKYRGKETLEKIAECYEQIGMPDMAAEYIRLSMESEAAN